MGVGPLMTGSYDSLMNEGWKKMRVQGALFYTWHGVISANFVGFQKISPVTGSVSAMWSIGTSAEIYGGGGEVSKYQHIFAQEHKEWNHFAQISLRTSKGSLPNREGYTSKVSRFPSNSFVMVKCKTFRLKHHIVFVKIWPPTGQITFWLLTSKMGKIKMLLA